eukprot:753882-Hanusia_phi.AAC.1
MTDTQNYSFEGDGLLAPMSLALGQVSSCWHLMIGFVFYVAQHSILIPLYISIQGISLTGFKNVCKKLRIQSWPSSRGSIRLSDQ